MSKIFEKVDFIIFKNVSHHFEIKKMCGTALFQNKK